MKKTLVALAALAAFGSASAEVIVYGKVDLGLSSKTTTGATDQGLEVTSTNYETSRLGVKASTDLTGGIKALAQYEMGIDAATYQSALTTDRVAMVGLTGGFGTVSLGLQWTPYDNAWAFDQMEYNGFSAANKVWYKGVHGDNGNTGNGNAKKSIAYTTPDISGFNASLMYANDATKTATTNNVPYIGLGANYVAGPLNVNFAYESVASSLQNAGAASDEKTTAYIVGASYNLGMATIGAGFQQANVDAVAVAYKESGYTLTVGIPVTATTTVALGYASETTTSSGLTDGTAKGFGAQAIYSWTPQVAVYGGAYQTKTTAVATTTETIVTKYAAGLRYNF
jgi:predicted porin